MLRQLQASQIPTNANCQHCLSAVYLCDGTIGFFGGAQSGIAVRGKAWDVELG